MVLHLPLVFAERYMLVHPALLVSMLLIGTVHCYGSSWGAEFLSSAAIGADGTVYIGRDDPPCFSGVSTVLALNADGTMKWGSGFCGFIFYASPSIAADGTIYIGANGKLLSID